MQKSRDLITRLIIVSTLVEELPSSGKGEVEFINMLEPPLKIPYLLPLEMSLSTQSTYSSILETGPSDFRTVNLKLWEDVYFTPLIFLFFFYLALPSFIFHHWKLLKFVKELNIISCTLRYSILTVSFFWQTVANRKWVINIGERLSDTLNLFLFHSTFK